jgi:hypothetical protein
MKRTAAAALFLLGALLAQSPPSPVVPGAVAPTPAAAADPTAALVARMAAAEAKLRSAQLVMTTRGNLPGGLAVEVRGELRVLRGTQPALHTAFTYRFGDGFRGRAESAQTAAGIVTFHDDPAFGELYLRYDPTVVADLEWAGGVLQRSDLPGMADRRAGAPLGATVLAGLGRQFALAPDARRDRQGEAGTWLVGPRRSGLEGGQAEGGSGDLPLADRVEAFVRERDLALLEVVHHQGEVVVQHLVVESLALDVELPAARFTVDGRGLRLRDVQEHAPSWEQVEQVLRQAEVRAEREAEASNAKLPAEPPRPPERRPSRR